MFVLVIGLLPAYLSIYLSSPKGGRGVFDVSPLSGISGLSVWSHFYISPLLFFCLVLLLLSFTAFGPFSWSRFPWTSSFQNVGSFVWLLPFLFVWAVRRCVFSWWYVQDMLPYGTGIIAFVHVYSIFCLHLFLFFFLFFFKIWYWKARPTRSMVPASPNFICHILQELYRRDTLLDYVCMFYVHVMCMFCIVFNLCYIWICENPWGDPVVWMGLYAFNK